MSCRQFEYLRVELDPWGFPAWQQPFFVCLEGECTTVATVARCQLKRRVSELYRTATNEEMNFPKSLDFVSLCCHVSFLEGTWEAILT